MGNLLLQFVATSIHTVTSRRKLSLVTGTLGVLQPNGVILIRWITNAEGPVQTGWKYNEKWKGGSLCIFGIFLLLVSISELKQWGSDWLGKTLLIIRAVKEWNGLPRTVVHLPSTEVFKM